VSRGGRPDLAGPRLAEVHAPTLLLVGGRDELVLERNRQAQAQLGGPSALEVIGGAGHLFEEPRALDRVAALAAAWFCHHLPPPAQPDPKSPPPADTRRPDRSCTQGMTAVVDTPSL
jgi:putative phosphoribosyl transferase